MRKPFVFKEPPPSRLVLALMWNPKFSLEEFIPKLQTIWGEIKSQSLVYDFIHTQYYKKEMGEGLRKVFIEINGLFSRDSLVGHKLKATELENKYLDENKNRLLNVDPLFVNLENIVISTSKAFSHRAYLEKGVYADVAFIWHTKHFEALPWTYPDYKQNVHYFEDVRAHLKNLLVAKNVLLQSHMQTFPPF